MFEIDNRNNFRTVKCVISGVLTFEKEKKTKTQNETQNQKSRTQKG